MKRNPYFPLYVFVVLAIAGVAIWLWPKPQAEPVKELPKDSFTVPEYAKLYSVMNAAADIVYRHDWTHLFYGEGVDDESIIEPGYVGILVSDEAYTNLEEYYADFGQTCSFNHRDNTFDIQREGKSFTLHAKATVLDQNFLQLCEREFPDGIEVYVVTAQTSNGEFIITYTKEVWTVNTIYGLEE